MSDAFKQKFNIAFQLLQLQFDIFSKNKRTNASCYKLHLLNVRNDLKSISLTDIDNDSNSETPLAPHIGTV